MLKPFYVKSGQLECKLLAEKPFDAAVEAFLRFSDYKVLDARYFYVGERSADNPGSFKYTVDEVFTAAGVTDIEDMEGGYK